MGSINAKDSQGSFGSDGSADDAAMEEDAKADDVAMVEAPGADDEDETVPYVFRWEHGGHNVFLTGTFTGWDRHIPMHRSGHDFVTIVHLPRGKHAFKFIVDNDWRFSPEQPIVRDTNGNINNYTDLSTFTHDDTAPIDYSAKMSNPSLAYSATIPDVDSYMREPPSLPPHLRDIILNSPAQEADPHVIRSPQHVTLNHLYCTAFRDGLMVQGVTQRYKDKFVTTVFYSSATEFTGAAPGVARARSAPESSRPAAGARARPVGAAGAAAPPVLPSASAPGLPSSAPP